MTVTKTSRLFTLTAAALLAMIVLSASSINAAPVTAPDSDTLFGTVGETAGTIVGYTAPQSLVKGGLNGYNEARGNNSPPDDQASQSVVDNTLENAGKVLGEAATKNAPASFVDAGAASAKKAAGL